MVEGAEADKEVTPKGAIKPKGRAIQLKSKSRGHTRTPSLTPWWGHNQQERARLTGRVVRRAELLDRVVLKLIGINEQNVDSYEKRRNVLWN